MPSEYQFAPMDPLPIRFVLVDTTHPGNIGAVARAMKNMGLVDLVLVNPREFPHPEATARASGADDLLLTARVVPTLAEAIADCGLVLATTSRERDHYFRVMQAREGAVRAVQEARQGAGVAVLFGTERNGLSNEQLLSAHALLFIPSNPEYTSLNVAMAAQLIAYEIRMAQHVAAQVAPAREVPLATAADMERLYAHLEQVMEEVGFRDRTQSGTALTGRIRRFLNRAEPDANEVNILRGMLTAVQSRRRRAGGD
ncbi:MAG: RNA methyltransferase [Pseudomonadota bacterium]